jgi:hypothetical protein
VTTLTATSAADAGVHASAALTTIAVAVDTLLVDEDGNAPDVAGRYQAALTANGTAFSTWVLTVALDDDVVVGARRWGCRS